MMKKLIWYDAKLRIMGMDAKNVAIKGMIYLRMLNTNMLSASDK